MDFQDITIRQDRKMSRSVLVMVQGLEILTTSSLIPPPLREEEDHDLDAIQIPQLPAKSRAQRMSKSEERDAAEKEKPGIRMAKVAGHPRSPRSLIEHWTSSILWT